MTSQINTTNIDILYPIAGQDNNSQGFRDNFAAIQQGLATAKSEITALQSTALVSADSSNAPVTNNFNGSTLSNGFFNQFYGTVYNAGLVNNSTETIDLANGTAQAFSLTQNTTFTFQNWPSEGFGIVRVHIKAGVGGVFVPTFQTHSGTIVYDTNYPSSPVGLITVSATSVFGSAITVSDSSSLNINDPIYFTQSLGNLIAGSVYYVKQIVSPTQITVTAISNGTQAVVMTDSTSIGNTYLKKANIQTPGFTVGGESLLSTTITASGDGFTLNPLATVSVSGGTLLTQYVTPTLSPTYKVNSATPSGGSGGTGYAVGDILVLNSNPSVTFQVPNGGVDGSGVLTQPLTVLTNGGPLSTPIYGVKSVSAITGSGTGARLFLKAAIYSLNILNPGDGYATGSVAPTITITGGTSTATAVATLTNSTADNTKVVEAWTIDGGTTVNMRYLGEY